MGRGGSNTQRSRHSAHRDVASPIDPENAECSDSRNGQKYATNSPDLTADRYGKNREKRVQVHALTRHARSIDIVLNTGCSRPSATRVAEYPFRKDLPQKSSASTYLFAHADAAGGDASSHVK